MSRRSFRLESTDYYDSDGEPTISYREHPYRVFRRRRRRLSINRAAEYRRPPFWFNLKRVLFFTLILCFGGTYLRSSFVDPGASELLVAPTTTNMDLSAGCVDLEKQLRELKDELLVLKEKINYLLPAADLLPNFALESLGASVLNHLSSKAYPNKDWRFFGMNIGCPSVSHRTVIQGDSSLVPGRCWAFAGGRGHLAIALSHPVTITHVTLGHIQDNVSPNGTISSAPKQFSVYGLKTLEDEGTQLGTFLYGQNGDPVQTFKLPDHQKDVFRYVRLQIESNWGNPDFTCLYSFRVHGKLAE